MQTELKDVIHLYIGCDVNTGTGTVTLVGVHIDNFNGVCKAVVLNGNVTHTTDMDNLKPILRSLDSLTEEEFIELFKQCSLFDLSDCSFEVQYDDEDKFINAELNGRVIDCIQIVSGDCVMMMNNDGSFSPINPQSKCQLFFLSKHFDLFNLIESNQALDEGTVK